MTKFLNLCLVLSVAAMLACGGGGDGDTVADVTQPTDVLVLDIPTIPDATPLDIPKPDTPADTAAKPDTASPDLPVQDLPPPLDTSPGLDTAPIPDIQVNLDIIPAELPAADVSGDVLSGVMGCDPYFDCMNEHCAEAADYDALVACLATHCDPEAQVGVPNAVMGLMVCFADPCADDSSYGCIFANCAAEYFFCYHGTANVTCEDTLTCLSECPAGDAACGPNCIDQSTLAAGTDLADYWTCQDVECPSAQQAAATDLVPCAYDADGYYIDPAKCSTCIREAESGVCASKAAVCGESAAPFGTADCATTVTCLAAAETDAAFDACLDAASKTAYETVLRLYFCVWDDIAAGNHCATECGDSGTDEACDTCFFAAMQNPFSPCVGCGGGAACEGACDEDDLGYCMADGTTVCVCDTDYSEFFSLACSDYCDYVGGTGADCNTTPDGPECDCAFSCSDSTIVQKQCDAMLYTPCTCAVADPCDWNGDNVCDKDACDALYPNQNNFDDSATDCL